MSATEQTKIEAADRAWLPLVRLLLDRQGSHTTEPFKARHREMNNRETYCLAAAYYLVSLSFLGACMLPGLAILPFGEFLAWPILLITHLVLLHLVLLATGWVSHVLSPALRMVKVSRMQFQILVFLGGLTLLAIPLAFVGGLPAWIAWSWLAFCALNVLASIILFLK